jgi:hypothetical protein
MTAEERELLTYENWAALFIAIENEVTTSKALNLVGISLKSEKVEKNGRKPKRKKEQKQG